MISKEDAQSIHKQIATDSFSLIKTETSRTTITPVMATGLFNELNEIVKRAIAAHTEQEDARGEAADEDELSDISDIIKNPEGGDNGQAA